MWKRRAAGKGQDTQERDFTCPASTKGAWKSSPGMFNLTL